MRLRLFYGLLSVITLILLLPILALLWSWTDPQIETWRYLWESQLLLLVGNTLFLLCGVLLVSSVLGLGLAWLNTGFNYPGRKWLDVALVLPLAIPSYILAFAFLGVFGIGGTVQNTLSLLITDYVHIDIRHRLTVVWVLGLALFPYTYLLTRASLLSQGVELLEASRALGLGLHHSFLRVVLPATRPALMAGMLFVSLDTLAEIGAVSIFNYDTFTTAIYKTWFGLFNFTAAIQLASLLLLIALILPMIEKYLRGRARFVRSDHALPRKHIDLHGYKAFIAFLIPFLVFCMGFLFPIGQLLWWSFDSWKDYGWIYGSLLTRTVHLALMVTFITLLLGTVLVASARWYPHRIIRFLRSILGVTYALPGIVLAAGAVIVSGALAQIAGDQAPFWIAWFFPGSLGVLVLTCVSRYMTLSMSSLESGMDTIRRSLSEVAFALGVNKVKLLFRIYVPLMLPTFVVASLLVFVETMREMPITLLLRPFGWDTLAVKIFSLSAEGEWQRAAPPALILVVIGLVPVLLALRQRYPVRHRSPSSY